jgi:hypothetical protein
MAVDVQAWLKAEEMSHESGNAVEVAVRLAFAGITDVVPGRSRLGVRVSASSGKLS